MTDKQPAKSTLNKTGQKAANHVAFDNVPDKPKPAAPAQPAGPPAQVTIPPPVMNFQLKDEVELLRGGYKNTHGDQVKTQGQAAGGGGAAGAKKAADGAAVEITL